MFQYGLGVSFLERLMAPEFSCFNRQNETKEYNPNVVTKLLNNYRSHPAILKVISSSHPSRFVVKVFGR